MCNHAGEDLALSLAHLVMTSQESRQCLCVSDGATLDSVQCAKCFLQEYTHQLHDLQIFKSLSLHLHLSENLYLFFSSFSLYFFTICTPFPTVFFIFNSLPLFPSDHVLIDGNRRSQSTSNWNGSCRVVFLYRRLSRKCRGPYLAYLTRS